MKHIEDLCHRFSDRAMQIRRHSLRDPKFRSICDDYGEALRAIEIQRGRGVTSTDRAEEFHRIAEDLREELLTYLNTSSSTDDTRVPVQTPLAETE
jgi:hypothetical protein